MFAVVILGIGMILIASLFPVAISQIQASVDDTAGRAVLDSGYQTLQAAAQLNGTVPLTATTSNRLELSTATDSIFNRTTGNRINTADPTLAWVAVYRRLDLVDPPRVTLWAIRSRSGNFYNPLMWTNTGEIVRRVQISLAPGTIDTVSFTGTPPETSQAVEYAFIVVSDGTPLALLGKSFQLGARDPSSAILWEIQPQSYRVPAAFTGFAFIVGRAKRDPTLPYNSATNPYEGKAQDIAVLADVPLLVP